MSLRTYCNEEILNNLLEYIHFYSTSGFEDNKDVKFQIEKQIFEINFQDKEIKMNEKYIISWDSDGFTGYFNAADAFISLLNTIFICSCGSTFLKDRRTFSFENRCHKCSLQMLNKKTK